MNNTHYAIYVKYVNDTIRFRTVVSTAYMVRKAADAMWKNNHEEIKSYDGEIQQSALKLLAEEPYKTVFDDTLQLFFSNSTLYGITLSSKENVEVNDLVRFAKINTGYGKVVVDLETGEEMPLMNYKKDKSFVGTFIYQGVAYPAVDLT